MNALLGFAFATEAFLMFAVNMPSEKLHTMIFIYNLEKQILSYTAERQTFCLRWDLTIYFRL